jgi:hypothetical protein
MSWQHLRDSRPTARKEHRCYLCELPIAIGEKHVQRVGVSFGQFDHFRMHEQCEAATQSWDQHDWECSSGCGAEFREYLSEQLIQQQRR